MPKEITHWTLAEAVFQRLPEQSAIKIALFRNKRLFLLGACVFDTPFHDSACCGRQSIRPVGVALHDTSISSYTPIVRMLSRCGETRYAEALIAFALGGVMHIICDSVFHPMVCFYSGNMDEGREKRSLARHRLIETAIDVYYEDKKPADNQGLVYRLTSQAEIDKSRLYKWISALFGLERSETPAVARALSYHGAYQKAFRCSRSARLLNIARRLTPADAGCAINLFYFEKSALDMAFFTRAVGYRHPVTGVCYQKTIEDLSGEAIMTGFRLFAMLESCTDPREVARRLSSIAGPNLISGLSGVTSGCMRFFDAQAPIGKRMMKRGAAHF